MTKFVNLKHARGFDQGYVYILKGPQEKYTDFFQLSAARFSTDLGWYFIPGTEGDLPEGITFVKLDWSAIGNEAGDEFLDNYMDTVYEVRYPENKSAFVGEVGQRLEIMIKVIEKEDEDSGYGTKSCHYFIDAKNNIYMWATTAKHWEIGEEHKIRGTVKEHQTIKGRKTTVLTNCRER